MPFAAIVCFDNKLRGFLSMLVLSAATHMLIGLATQSLHLFSYPVVFTLHLCIGIAWFIFAARHKRSVFKVDWKWFPAAAFVVVFLFLSSIHYFYSGIVDTSFGTRLVSQSSYTYPMYSDEWVAVSLVDYSIANKALPLVNPLDANSPFINFLAGFHILVSEVFLLLSLTPLSHYVWFAIFNGMMICLLVYFILRSLSVSRYASAVVVMSIPFITNSGNLPGIWYLLPYSASSTFLLVAILGFLIRSRLVSSLGLVLALVIYPPMIVFILPVLVGASISTFGRVRKKLSNTFWVSIGILIVAAILVFLIGLGGFNPGQIVNRAISFVVRDSLDMGRVWFAVWNVLPLFILPLVIIGVRDFFRRKIYYIILPILVGTIYWIAYSFTSSVLIIEPSRIVLVTSLLLTIIAGFGIDTMYTFFVRKFPQVIDPFIINSLKCITLIFFILMFVFSSRFALWHKSVLVIGQQRNFRELVPAPPVTRYLTEDDLRLFSSIEGKRFISPPWKGLVIGAATHNFPLDSKNSTLTNKMLSYDVFMKADCEQKKSYAIKYNIDFAYTNHFSCPSFAEVGKSYESLMLYEFKSE